MVKELPQFEQQVAIQPRELPDIQASKSALIDKLTQFGFGVAKAIRTHSKAELDAEKSAAQIQLRDGASHIRQKVLDPDVFSDSAVENYDAQMSGLGKGILATVHPQNKAAVANYLSYYGDRGRDVVVTRVQSLKKNQRIGGLQEYNTKITDDAVNSKLSGEVIPDPEDKTKSISKGDFLISQVNQANDDAMNRGLISPKEAFTYKEAAHKSYAEASYVGQFQQAVAQGHDPNKWLESLNKNKNVDTATKQKVQFQAAGTVNKIQQSVQTNQNLIQQQADEAIKQVSQGLDINSQHVSNVRLRADALPGEDRQGIEHRLTAASVFSVAKNEMKFIPFNKSEDILEKMKPLADDPDFKIKDKMSNALKQQLNSFRTQFKKDPFAYVSDNPEVTKAFEARNVAANDGSIKIQPAQLQSINPLDVALDKERMMGANNQQLSVMGKDTSANIISSLDGLPDVKSKVQFLNDVFDSYGKHKNIANRDLRKAGAPQNILDLANLDKTPSAKPFLQGIYNSVEQKPAIEQALKDRNKVGEHFSDFRNAAITELNPLMNTFGFTADSEQFKNNMVDLTSTAAAGYFLAGKSGSADDAAKKMANAIYNSRYSGYAKEVRIPINVPMSNAKDALFATEKEMPKMNFTPLTREPESDETKIMRILQNNSDKNFVQRILKPKDKPTLDLGGDQFATHKMSWTTVDGKPIVYPKVVQDKKTGKLKELGTREAVQHALKTKEFITAKNNDEAEWFSSNYKKVWNIEGKNITLKKGIAPALTKGEIMQDDMNTILGGKWRTIGDDSGAYWVDGNGFTPQVLEKGEAHRLEIHWKDLQDSTSELHALMAKHPRKRFGLF